MSMSQPSLRRAARSAMVAFDPGSITRSASPGSARPTGTKADRDIGLGRQRIEVVEVGDPGQAGDGDADAAGLRRSGSSLSSTTASSAGRRRARLEPGHDAECGQSGMLLDDREPVIEQAHVAAKLVDDITLEPCPLVRLEGRPRCRRDLRSRRLDRCRQRGQQARRLHRRSPCWRCRLRAG